METIEEKSFWTIAPAVAFIGLSGLLTAGLYSSAAPTIISAILCLVIPVILMFVVAKLQNYHNAYPILCISIGAISVPLTFIFSGGFFSGMPLFCVITTSITALCYERRWRIWSLIACLLGNGAAFYYVYVYGTPYPLEGDITIMNDILYSYIFAALGMFVALNFIIAEVRKYKLNQEVLQKYFDDEIRKEILKKSLNGDLSGITGTRKAVILFADISNFTPITEKMPPEQIGKFLNDYFTLAAKYIHENGGIIDKYIGDCIMAYWFENEKGNCVLEAIKAVTLLKQELYSESERIFEEYGTELNFSAGISYGEVIFGDIGSDKRHDFTVIGDAVNTASRIEDYAVGGEILISDAAAARVSGNVQLEKVRGSLYLKGKNHAIDLYRVLGLAVNRLEQKLDKPDDYGYALYVCGCRGSFPVSGLRFSEFGGETSCYVLRKDDYAIIVDCGTGLKNARTILNGCKKIDILLTHVHYDHILGLLISKLPEDADIKIYGHFQEWSGGKNTLENFMEHPYWPVQIVKTNNISIELGKENRLNDEVRATFYKSDHPDDGCVIKLMIRDKKVCFLADCEDAEKLDPSIARYADIAFFDGMFDDTETVDHTGWGHGTWQQGVEYAQTEQIKKLIITHHNPEVGDHTILSREKEARSRLDSVSFARAGDRILL